MIRTFVETPHFTKKWESLGLTDDDLRNLQQILLLNSKEGDVIPKTEGLRKIRIPIGEKGKRGGCRVIYVDIEIKECIYLLDIYAKNEMENLTNDQIKTLNKLVRILKED